MKTNGLDSFEWKKLDELIVLYRKGKSLIHLSEHFELPISFIKKLLLKYKESSRINKKIYKEEFKAVVAERYQNGVSKNEIAREIKVSKSFITNANASYQFNRRKLPRQSEYRLHSLYQPLDKCLFCNSTNTTDIETLIEKTLPHATRYHTTTGIYCKDCGHEYFYFNNDKEKDIFEVSLEE